MYRDTPKQAAGMAKAAALTITNVSNWRQTEPADARSNTQNRFPT
jgi:hypothetical protein